MGDLKQELARERLREAELRRLEEQNAALLAENGQLREMGQ